MPNAKQSFSNLEAALRQFLTDDECKQRSEEQKQETYRAQRNNEQKRYRAKKRAARQKNIAVLDFESDPFDNVTQEIVRPFLCVLYSRNFEPVIIWEEDHEAFIDHVLSAIEALPNSYTIYAHNGGKFDFMYLVHRLRGPVSFKGRGIMSAWIGNHQLRDSYHIIPEKLANLKKEAFDYNNLRKDRRANFRQTIIDYCISDCENLLDYVERFIEKFGFKISIGAAALATLSKDYKIERITETDDAYLRQFFFGGRVECIQGAGYFNHAQKLYDINSAYPDVMARVAHPIGNHYRRRPGQPNAFTCFLTVHCRNNGALMSRLENGDVTASVEEGTFHTTIHEFRMALDLDLIHDVEIIECVDCNKFSNFEKFVTPLYNERAELKEQLKMLKSGTVEWTDINARQIFLKLILNNAYGKTAQNPRRFKEHWLTAPGEFPPDETWMSGNPWQREFICETHWIWSRRSPHFRFLNVGTGASITGAVRAKLMKAIHSAINPVYCDTDSIICDELLNHELHASKLGAWDLEKNITELVLNGKKLYAYKAREDKKPYIKAKGAQGVTWNEMLKIYAGERLAKTNFGPTLTRRHDQTYITRTLRSTAPHRPSLERHA